MFRKALFLLIVISAMFPVFAEEKVCLNLEETAQILKIEVENRAENIDIPCALSDEALFFDPLQSALGVLGTRKYGQGYMLSGIKTYENRNEISGNVIHYKYKITYSATQEQMNEMDAFIRDWVSTNLSSDMDPAVKINLINQYIIHQIKKTDLNKYGTAYAAYSEKMANSFGITEYASRFYTAAGIQNEIATGLIKTVYNRSEVTNKELELAHAGMQSKLNLDARAANLVNLSGKWYYVYLMDVFADLPRDGYGQSYVLDSVLIPESFMRERIRMLSGEFPSATVNWWANETGERLFLEKYFKYSLYNYPMIENEEQMNTYIKEGISLGKERISFNVNKTAKIPDFTPALRTGNGQVKFCTAGNIFTGESGVWSKTIYIKYDSNRVVSDVLKLKNRITIESGETINYPLLSGLPGDCPTDIEFMVLSKKRLLLEGQTIKAGVPGKAFFAVANANDAAIVTVDIKEPVPKIILNNTRLQEIEPIIVNGRTLVPLRALLEALDVQVDYDPITRAIIAKRENTIVKMTLDSKLLMVNNTEKTSDTAPTIINGKTYVPARVIAENFGGTVRWDESRKAVVIDMASVSE